jgi:hypothetical protein
MLDMTKALSNSVDLGRGWAYSSPERTLELASGAFVNVVMSRVAEAQNVSRFELGDDETDMIWNAFIAGARSWWEDNA